MLHKPRCDSQSASSICPSVSAGLGAAVLWTFLSNAI